MAHISDKPLTVVFKNFMRNRMVNLTAKSVKHFIPNADIYCYSLYKQSEQDYADQDPLDPYIKQIWGQTKYVSGKTVYDSENSPEVSGYAHPDNGAYFAEGYNMIFEKFRDSDQKLLMLAEDHFFTSGATLREVMEIEWDVCFAPWTNWGAYSNVNGSILGVVPSRVGHLFPIHEARNTQVEWVFWHELVAKIPPERAHAFTTRREVNYMGDGLYTNGSETIRQKMLEAGIL